MMPRPWFLSLTAIWSDDAKATKELNTALSRLGQQAAYPQHQIEVRHEARHLTVFAILRLNLLPPSELSFRDFSRNLLAMLSGDKQVITRLRSLLKVPLTLKAYEIRVFDDGTVLQFQGSKDFAELRDNARAILAEPVIRLVESYEKGVIDSLVNDPKKNFGDHAYGSIARSPNRSDTPSERFRVALHPAVTFNFSRIHLLTSDDSLTNPRIPSIEDFIIYGKL